MPSLSPFPADMMSSIVSFIIRSRSVAQGNSVPERYLLAGGLVMVWLLLSLLVYLLTLLRAVAAGAAVMVGIHIVVKWIADASQQSRQRTEDVLAEIVVEAAAGVQ